MFESEGTPPAEMSGCLHRLTSYEVSHACFLSMLLSLRMCCWHLGLSGPITRRPLAPKRSIHSVTARNTFNIIVRYRWRWLSELATVGLWSGVPDGTAETRLEAGGSLASQRIDRVQLTGAPRR